MICYSFKQKKKKEKKIQVTNLPSEQFFEITSYKWVSTADIFSDLYDSCCTDEMD